MKSIDLHDYLINGRLFDFHIQNTEADVINKLGRPTDIEDYGDKGRFLHYNNLRFLIIDEKINYIDLFFINYDGEYFLEVNGETFVLGSNSSVLYLLNIFNHAGIKWKIIWEHSNLDYLVVEAENNVQVFFYYHKEKIERVSLIKAKF